MQDHIELTSQSSLECDTPVIVDENPVLKNFLLSACVKLGIYSHIHSIALLLMTGSILTVKTQNFFKS
jgi:hypothetical protein